MMPCFILWSLMSFYGMTMLFIFVTASAVGCVSSLKVSALRLASVSAIAYTKPVCLSVFSRKFTYNSKHSKWLTY